MSELNWIPHIEKELAQLDQKPQFGGLEDFSTAELESRLKDLLEISSLSLKHQNKGWLSFADVKKSCQDFKVFSFQTASFTKNFFFATTHEDLKYLLAEVFDSEEAGAFFYAKQMATAFFYYFSSEILNILEDIGFADPLNFRLNEGEVSVDELEDEPYFLIDTALKFKEKRFSGKIIVPASFREEWKKYFSGSRQVLSEEKKAQIIVELGLQVGHLRLGYNEFKKVRKGDFLILDHCSYDPQKKKGSVVITFQNQPLLRARFKEEGLKITNFPVYEEVNMPTENPFDDEEEFKDEDLEEDLFSEEEETNSFEEVREERKENGKKSGIIAEDLPIQITVEVGRIKMSAKELMELSSGNLLEMGVSPEEGVDLLVDGKKIAKGELVRLGEMLGVRIVSF